MLFGTLRKFCIFEHRVICVEYGNPNIKDKKYGI